MPNRIALVAAISLFSSAALAGGSFSANDQDNNGKLSQDEYYGAVSDVGTYSDWDTDSDGLLTEDEYDEIGLDYDFADWDSDDNNYLDAGEVYGGYYEAYDENENGHWENGEWDDAGDSGLWDV